MKTASKRKTTSKMKMPSKLNLCGIVLACTNRKDAIFMQRALYIDEVHTALDIFRLPEHNLKFHNFVKGRNLCFR